MRAILVVNLNFAVDKTAVVDGLRGGMVYRLSRVKTLPGGKGVNVSRALKSLGMASELAGFIAGYNGHWIKRALAAEGFKSRCIEYSPGESRICFSVIDSRCGTATDFNEEGDRVPVRAQAEFIRQFRRRMKNYEAVAFCGRIATGLGADFFRRLIAIARRAGKLTALDTSGAPLAAALKAGPDLVKVNSFEFSEITGEKFSAAAVSRFYEKVSACGVKYAVITNGGGEGLAFTPESRWRFSPVPVRVVTPVGAGDSFMAGMVYGFAKKLSRQDCLRTAIGCAASDCLSLGAGIIDKEQCAAFARKAILKPMLGKIRSSHG